jgi:muramidase (phage lysozyme)
MYLEQQQLRYRLSSPDDLELIQWWVQHKSPHRRRFYWRCAKQFQEFVNKPLAAVTLTDIQAFAVSLVAQKTPPRQLSQTLSALKSLFIFGYSTGTLPLHIAVEQWPNPRLKRRFIRQSLPQKFKLKIGLGVCVLVLLLPGMVGSLRSTPAAFNRMVKGWNRSMMAEPIHDLQLSASPLTDPNVRAFLDTIAWAEGTVGPDGYRTYYTGAKFNSYDTHPDKVFCAPSNGRSLCSSAAGRYQFLKPTFDWMKQKLNLPDFGPRSQDLAAIELIRLEGALDEIEAGNIRTAFQKVSGIWVHIEGAGYGQPEHSLDKLEQVYWQYRNQYEPVQIQSQN